MEVDFIPFSLFPYMCKICHFKTCGETASVRHSNFFLSNPPLQLDLHCVSLCLTTLFPPSGKLLCLKVPYSFINIQGICHFPLRGLLHSYWQKSCSFSVMGAACGEPVFLWLQILCSGVIIHAGDSEHICKWDKVSLSYVCPIPELCSWLITGTWWWFVVCWINGPGLVRKPLLVWFGTYWFWFWEVKGIWEEREWTNAIFVYQRTRRKAPALKGFTFPLAGGEHVIITEHESTEEETGAAKLPEKQVSPSHFRMSGWVGVQVESLWASDAPTTVSAEQGGALVDPSRAPALCSAPHCLSTSKWKSRARVEHSHLEVICLEES